MAIFFSLIGLAVHVFVFASIVLMSVLLGLIAADFRGGRGGGVIAGLVAEAKDAAEDITHGGKAKNEEPAPDSPEREVTTTTTD